MGEIQPVPTTPAPPLSLNSFDWMKWRQDLVIFASVPAVAYLTAVLGVIQLPWHVISPMDFVPTNTTIIFLVAYILNSIISIFKKYIS